MQRFCLYPLRFSFQARDSIRFPRFAANRIRGALGLAVRSHSPETYAQLFEPTAVQDGGSRIRHAPRPYVIRAWHLDGVLIPPGSFFHFDIHLFDVTDKSQKIIESLVAAMERFAHEGLGPSRGRLAFDAVRRIDDPEQRIDESPLCLSLTPSVAPCRRVRIEFLTPMELKHDGGFSELPHFGILFRRLAERISNLQALYGAGPLAVDWRSLVERATDVQLISHALREVTQKRRSSRSGLVHDLGGWIGVAEYEGELGEFLPMFRIAEWTGVGRQTVWGKGVVRLSLVC